ncbi:unnamed protein product [Caenorhabditis auriculariae]|uniref:Uncharacterized protein n=1 Tax=Caenorhabditis auriculariae TaxID=2777116 RepID=A0A8S1H344_9PELO|nr:unnamed protein product [Caenorhabditis auriculariae]
MKHGYLIIAKRLPNVPKKLEEKIVFRRLFLEIMKDAHRKGKASSLHTTPHVFIYQKNLAATLLNNLAGTDLTLLTSFILKVI